MSRRVTSNQVNSAQPGRRFSAWVWRRTDNVSQTQPPIPSQWPSRGDEHLSYTLFSGTWHTLPYASSSSSSSTSSSTCLIFMDRSGFWSFSKRHDLVLFSQHLLSDQSIQWCYSTTASAVFLLHRTPSIEPNSTLFIVDDCSACGRYAQTVSVF